MASYDTSSFDKMRQEAVARVREMQRRAQGLAGENQSQQFAAAQAAAEQSREVPESEERQATPSAQHSSGGGILSSLLGADSKIDEEKALIGMLIYILYKNGADVKLMLALGYLLL